MILCLSSRIHCLPPKLILFILFPEKRRRNKKRRKKRVWGKEELTKTKEITLRVRNIFNNIKKRREIK
jgi:hypothetical protein